MKTSDYKKLPSFFKKRMKFKSCEMKIYELLNKMSSEMNIYMSKT